MVWGSHINLCVSGYCYIPLAQVLSDFEIFGLFKKSAYISYINKNLDFFFSCSTELMDFGILMFVTYIGFFIRFVMCTILVYEILYRALKRCQRCRGYMNVGTDDDEMELPPVCNWSKLI